MSAETTTSSRTRIPWLLGTLAAFAIFAAIARYSERMTNDFPTYDQGRAQARYDTLAKLREDATKTLGTVAWIDQSKGTVQIPIEEAMAKELDTLKAKPAAMGAVIPGTMPKAPTAAVAPAAPAAASTNAAPVTPTPTPAKTTPTATGPGAAATAGKPSANSNP
jgi:hypothetical protein